MEKLLYEKLFNYLNMLENKIDGIRQKLSEHPRWVLRESDDEDIRDEFYRRVKEGKYNE